MGFRIQKLSMPPWGCGVRESKDRHLARCNSFAWSKEAKYSVTFNNSLGTSPKHFQKSQHMQLTACPAPHDWHDWKCNYRAYSNIRIVYWCYCTELSVQHCLLPDSVRYLTCSLLTGYVLRLVHNILACNAVWLEVHIHWFGHALQHITSKNRTFSILALPICVYMHFRLHRTTSQNIVNQEMLYRFGFIFLFLLLFTLCLISPLSDCINFHPSSRPLSVSPILLISCLQEAV